MRPLYVNLVVISISIATFSAATVQAAYVDVVQADNPHGYWRLGEGSGTTAYNQVGYPTGENGTYLNTPALATTGIPGAGGDTAVNFDGSNDFVRILDSHDPTDYALEAWVNVDTLPAAWANFVMRTDSGELNAFSHILQVLSDGTFRHYTYASGGKSVDSTTLAVPGQWYHVVGVFHPGTSGTGYMSIYVNGTREGHSPGTFSNPWAGGDRWLLADSHAAGPYFDGTIDEAAVYHDVLAESDIQEHYAVGIPEPSTFTLTALGLLGLLAFGRRRRR